MPMEKAVVLCTEMGTRKAALLSTAVYFLSYGTASFRATQFTQCLNLYADTLTGVERNLILT